MLDTLTICIADIPIQLKFDCADQARARVAEHYAAFIAPAESGAFKILVREEPGEPYIATDVYQTYQIHTRVQGNRVEFESYLEKGWADHSTRTGELIMRPRGDPENFIRVLYAWLCIAQSGLLIHAAGIIAHGKGYVFFGPSGDGKTTTARLSMEQNHTVLSDDMVIIKKRGERYWLYGVPFRGDFPEAPRVNADAELAGLFTLVKDSEHRIEPMTPPEAIARLSACVPFVMAQASNAARVIGLVSRLEAHVPVRALHFRRDAGFWEKIL